MASIKLTQSNNHVQYTTASVVNTNSITLSYMMIEVFSSTNENK